MKVKTIHPALNPTGTVQVIAIGDGLFPQSFWARGDFGSEADTAIWTRGRLRVAPENVTAVLMALKLSGHEMPDIWPTGLEGMRFIHTDFVYWWELERGIHIGKIELWVNTRTATNGESGSNR